MRYNTDRKRVAENHRRFRERQDLYKSRGLDQFLHRESLLERTGSLGERILEIGSGRGYLALAMARAGYRFVSIDRDPEMTETAILNLAHENRLESARFCLCDAGALCFGDEAFDMVIAVDFFHHADCRKRIVAEIDRVMKPGGRAVVSDFNRRGREILDAVHREEGRSHPEMLPAASMKAPFAVRGYSIEEGEDDCHWYFAATKSR